MGKKIEICRCSVFEPDSLGACSAFDGNRRSRRAATADEQQRWLRRVRKVRWLKGHRLLRGDLSAPVRELTFTGALAIRAGVMTRAH